MLFNLKTVASSQETLFVTVENLVLRTHLYASPQQTTWAVRARSALAGIILATAVFSIFDPRMNWIPYPERILDAALHKSLMGWAFALLFIRLAIINGPRIEENMMRKIPSDIMDFIHQNPKDLSVVKEIIHKNIGKLFDFNLLYLNWMKKEKHWDKLLWLNDLNKTKDRMHWPMGLTSSLIFAAAHWPLMLIASVLSGSIILPWMQFGLGMACWRQARIHGIDEAVRLHRAYNASIFLFIFFGN